jgi:LuxR family maltose regulon positive regulatory protein
MTRADAALTPARGRPDASSPTQPLVPRRRLLDRLSGPPATGVVLLCAQAGSGKTTLLRSWVEAEELGDRVAWVSVERGERDGQRFWLAVIDALARTAGGDGVVHPVSAAPDLRSRTIVERLLAALEGLREPVLLVIDNLHHLGSADALESLELCLERLPARLRIVLSTREEPRIGLHRLRVEGRLTEIRSADLRFSIDEARELLDATGLTLSDADVASLCERTEGWAAGLRLAAMSLAGHPQPERFIAEFCGGERTVAEYLIAEVLERQPPQVRDLLLRTSVLERVNGPLGDLLTGRGGSEQVLQSLEDANAFVISLDAGRTWFRSCYLFADLLRLELRRTAPAIIDSLHYAAARWFEQHGYVVEAIRHAQAARDWSRASGLLAGHGVDLILDGRMATLRELLSAFPADARATDPVLAIASAMAAIPDGRFADGQVHIDHAARLLTALPYERRRRFDPVIASLRLWLAGRRCDIGAVSEARRSLEGALTSLTPPELALENDLQAAALLNLGTAELWSSDLDDACRDLEAALALARRIRRPYLQVRSLGHLCVAYLLRGSRLSVGIEIAGEAVTTAEAHGWGDDSAVAAPLAARGAALVWLGRLEEGEESLDRAQRTLGDDAEPGVAYILDYGRGVLELARGRPEDALVAFSAAERTQSVMTTEHPLSVELQSRRLQAQLTLGDVAGARAAVAGIAPALRDRAVTRVSEAAIHLADAHPEDAVDVLAPVLQRPDAPVRLGWARIQALLYDAVAREQLGDARAAAASLDRALDLAAPERIILPFMLPPARELLQSHELRRTAHPELSTALRDVLARSSPRARAAPPRGELSPAELRVLSRLPGDLTVGEIASRLYLSTNTVRTHLRHIYSKLDVHSRGQAVARARELGLLMSH